MATEASSLIDARPVALYFDVLDFQPATIAAIEARFRVCRLSSPTDDADFEGDDVKVLFAPMGFKFDRARLERFPSLQAIGSPTTGVPHIDIDYAASRKIAVCSLRHEQAFLGSITPTAELAWALILGVTRRIPWAHRAVCAGEWSGKSFGRRTPRMLSAMSLGVVGLGRLGGWVARYGTAFGMTVRYYDPHVTRADLIAVDSPLALASQSDVVSMHVHATDETRDMANRDFFSAMKPGSFFINTARGDVVDEAALLAALESGHLAGAGLDTLKGEHLPGFTANLPDHPLVRFARTHDNLLLTPHYGGSTRDAWERTEMRIVTLIDDALAARRAPAQSLSLK